MREFLHTVLPTLVGPLRSAISFPARAKRSFATTGLLVAPEILTDLHARVDMIQASSVGIAF